MARTVETALAATPDIVSAKANPLTGMVLVIYNAASVSRIAEIIDACVEGRWSHSPAVAENPQTGAAPGVEGATPVSEDHWHARTAEQASAALGSSSEDGLSQSEARSRLLEHGRNELARVPPRSVAALIAEQLESLPVGLLGVSALLSLATGGVADAIMIAAVVALNAAIATATERDAERTIRGLADYAAQPVPAMRDGQRILLHPAELTVGDLISLERGTLIAADARLVTSDNLSVNEAPLTGEAMPVRKNAAQILPPDTSLTDRTNMVFRGTGVTGGSASAVVTATGVATELGRVQALLGTVRPPETPIQR